MSDYLFNATGESEEDIRHMERVLGELRFKAAPLDFDRVETSEIHSPIIAPARGRWWMFSSLRLTPAMCAAASVIFAVAALGLWFTWFMSHSPTLVHAPAADVPSHDVQSIEHVVSPLHRNQSAEQSAPLVASTREIKPDTTKDRTSTAHGLASSSRNLGRSRKSRAVRNGATTSLNTKTPAVAADELLLALDITQRSLDKAFDKTEEKVRSQFSTVRLPVFMTDTAR